jgi:hypothetical protein
MARVEACALRAPYFASAFDPRRTPGGTMTHLRDPALNRLRIILVFAMMFAASRYLSLKCTAIKSHQRIEQADCYDPKDNFWRL